MLVDIDVILDDNKLSQYDGLLSRYDEWKTIQREIKLSSLLGSSEHKIQFDMEDIKNMYISIENSRIVDLQSACISVKYISFIIKGDYIEKLTFGCMVLDTYYGNIVKSFIKTLNIRQVYDLDYNIVNFYLDLPKEAA